MTSLAFSGGICPQDWTPYSELQAADCFGTQQEYELEFYDDAYGPGTLEDTGVSSAQDAACIDGHDVCAGGCNYVHQEIVNPPIPNSTTEEICYNGSQEEGYIWWDLDSEELYAQDQCNPSVDNCWTDVTLQYVSGTSDSYTYFCDVP